jgi:hypothetical protein
VSADATADHHGNGKGRHTSATVDRRHGGDDERVEGNRNGTAGSHRRHGDDRGGITCCLRDAV